MLAWLKLSHHTHSGRLRPHEHTSYLPLGFLLIFVGFALTAYTAVASSPPPQSSSIGISGTVPAKPPTIAAILTAPANGSHFATSPVTFAGTCPPNTLVEIFKDDIFGGSTPCSDAGKFSIDVDLLIGKNTITAKVYDSLNQPGPPSNSLTVFYDALPPQAGPTSSLDFGGSQLLLNTDAVFRGIFPEQELSIPIDVLGGAPPYAVNVQWGDTTNKVIPRNDNATFNATHIYTKPGVYQISIQASDAGGRVAFLTVASIVNGQPSIAATTTGGLPAQTNKLLLLWPLYTSTVAVVVSFWLGERREKQLLNKRGLLLSQ
jgi:hypothetical protein